jgi:hypothetical protein
MIPGHSASGFESRMSGRVLLYIEMPGQICYNIPTKAKVFVCIKSYLLAMAISAEKRFLIEPQRLFEI